MCVYFKLNHYKIIHFQSSSLIMTRINFNYKKQSIIEEVFLYLNENITQTPCRFYKMCDIISM